MKQRLLLILVMTSFITLANAQKKQQKTTGFAVTAAEKGGRGWKEVRLIDFSTGETLRSVYQSNMEMQVMNARTGKPVLKKETAPRSATVTYTIRKSNGEAHTATINTTAKKVVHLDEELARLKPDHKIESVVIYKHSAEPGDQPFSTNSAAMAYDRKHERLYYTPMGINQLRYIDLKGSSPGVFYFEDEPFGVVKGMGDVASHMTRMVIASDGKGYALTNDGNHLVRFTTGRKPVITDLGAIADDGANGENSIHHTRMYGGDMIADTDENLYLFTAGRHVFRISIESMTAKYLGVIKGLPKGFTTNGAMVAAGSKVIVASSQSTEGYYRVDLNTLESEKVSGNEAVFNASDLANGNLAVVKKKKDQPAEQPAVVVTPDETTTAKNNPGAGANSIARISVFPNPVTDGVAKLSFEHQPAGRYQVQLLDLSGKLISATEVNIVNESQQVELRMPELSVKGNYFIRISGETNKVTVTSKIVVQ